MAEFIPQFSLARQWESVGAELEAATRQVLIGGRYAQGPECAAFEAEAAEYLAPKGGVTALSCASGTDALHLGLRAAGVGSGDVVLTTPFTFFATASAVVQAGARPEFVDIRADDFQMSPERLAEAMERRPGGRPAAILPVHLYGGMAPMEEILEAAGATPVVEDAAQAFGAAQAGRAAGTWGEAGCFSFYPTKNLGAAGEGGLVTTRAAACAERIRLLRVHGSRERYVHEILGWNARMHELQAAVLRVKLRHLAGWTERRRAIARGYEERLRGAGAGWPGAALAGEAAAGEAALVLPRRTPDHVFHQYVVRARRRDALRDWLRRQDIAAEIYYPIPLHRQPALRELAGGGAFPETERAAAEVLALPMWPELREDELDRAAAALRSFYAQGAAAC